MGKPKDKNELEGERQAGVTHESDYDLTNYWTSCQFERSNDYYDP
jgi:hypothetical protein